MQECEEHFYVTSNLILKLSWLQIHLQKIVNMQIWLFARIFGKGDPEGRNSNAGYWRKSWRSGTSGDDWSWGYSSNTALTFKWHGSNDTIWITTLMLKWYGKDFISITVVSFNNEARARLFSLFVGQQATIQSVFYTNSLDFARKWQIMVQETCSTWRLYTVFRK